MPVTSKHKPLFFETRLNHDAVDFGLIVRLNCRESIPAVFVAWAVKEKEPAVLGVPLITPVEEVRERPPGSAPFVTVHVIGVAPELVRVIEHSVPTVPAESGDVLVIEGGVEELVPIAVCTAANKGCCGF